MFVRVSHQDYKDGARSRAAREQPVATNDVALPQRRPQLDAHFRRRPRINELLAGLHPVKFETMPDRLGGHRQRQRVARHPGRAGHRRPQRVRHRATSASATAANVGVQRHQDLPAHEKFSLFKGRHSLKFGGRWLYHQQRFAYSGNEGLLGHFNYNGAFTGFAFADFLLDQSPRRARGGLVEPFTHLQNRIGIFVQDDFKVRNNLTLNLGLAWEYTSPWVEKDDRQANIDLQTGQLHPGRPERQQPRALRRRTTAASSHGWDLPGRRPSKWVLRGGFGIVQYMEGTGKNLRLTQNPPGNFEGRRVSTPRPEPGTATVGFARHRSPDQRRPRDAVPHLPARSQAADHEAVEPLRGAPGQRLDLGPDRLRRQPARTTWSSPSTSTSPSPIRARSHLAAARPAPAALPPEPGHRRHQRDQLDRHRRLRRPAGERPAAPYGGPGVPRVLHVQQGAQRQRRVLRHRLGADGERRATTTWTAPTPGATTDGRPTTRATISRWPAPMSCPWARVARWGATGADSRTRSWAAGTSMASYQKRTGFAFTVIDGGGQSLQATRSSERPDRLCDGKTDASGADDIWIDIGCFARAPVGQFGRRRPQHHVRARVLEPRPRAEQDFHFDDRRYFTLRIEAFNALNHPNWARAQLGHLGSDELRKDLQHVLAAADRGAGRQVQLRRLVLVLTNHGACGAPAETRSSAPRTPSAYT